MKNKEIVSAAIGGAFFAVPYLVLAAPLLPSLAIGVVAFGAGELLLGEEKPTLKETNRKLYNILETAKKQNKRILQMIPMIEDKDIQEHHADIPHCLLLPFLQNALCGNRPVHRIYNRQVYRYGQCY